MTNAVAAEQRAEVLTETVMRLASAHTHEQVAAVAVEAACRLTGADGATLVVADGEACFAVEEGAVRAVRSAQRFPLGECLYGSVIGDPRVVQIRDAGLDDRSAYDPHVPATATSLCVVPMRPIDPVGALGVHWHGLVELGEEQVRGVEAVAAAAAVAVESLRLRTEMLANARERDRARERCEELETAVHVLAHDLRRPLATVLAAAELAAEDAIDVTSARTILTAGGAMSDRIERMLALYRVTNAQVAPEPVDLSSAAHDLVESLTSQCPERTVEIEIEEGLRATADPVLVRLLLENLLSNALKYTQRTPRAHISLASASRERGLTTFVVRDNGAGFDPDRADRLFRPLGRLHDERDFPGTGLGLASVARIVDLHGGSVRAEGRPQRGAAFYFSLPGVA